jgi:hypothetical protein
MWTCLGSEERLSLDQLDRLVDRIYEAAAISEFWPAVLDDIARFTESDSASFHSVRDHTVRAIGTPAANWLIEEFRPFAKTIVNTRTTRGRGRAEFGFLTDFDMFTPEELARPDAEQSVRSIPVAAREDRSPCILHLIPVRRAAQDIFSRSVASLLSGLALPR